MELVDNPLSEAGVKVLKPRVFKDERGYFFESYNSRVFESLVGQIQFVQDNQSLSKHGVLRGLHYQTDPRAQTKLVRVLKGAIWDVAVDLRKDSKTFGKWFGLELSDENQLQLLVPKGFAHGFVTLSDSALVAYKVDEVYSKEHDRGIRYDDPFLKIDWPVKSDLILSEKDRSLPLMANAEVFGSNA
jgi:dTDP-4-dehydrorhamnose 3,5-epimerase